MALRLDFTFQWDNICIVLLNNKKSLDRKISCVTNLGKIKVFV